MNKILDTIDTLFTKGNDFLDTTLPQIEDIHIGKNITIKRKTQLISMFMFGFISAIGLLWNIGTAFAHGGHGDAEAEQLGTSTGSLLTGPQFTSPIELDSSSVANQSYPGVIMSDEYGSIFSSRQGIITKLHVNLGDTVKKGQIVATIATPNNTPEIISLIASQKANIAISQGRVNGVTQSLNYLKSPGNGTDIVSTAYEQKKKAIGISYDVQGQQLQVKVDNLKKQLEARQQLVGVNKLSNESQIGLNDERKKSIVKLLQSSIQRSIALLGKVFAKGETTYQSFDYEFTRNIRWGARSDQQRGIFSSVMNSILGKYAILNSLSESEVFSLAFATQNALNEGIKLLGVTVSSVDYPKERLVSDIEDLVDASSNPDIGISTLISKYKELQKEVGGLNAVASGNIIQLNVEFASLQQEIDLLQSQKKLLDAEKNKELADLGGDQSVKNLDIQKIILESEQALILAKAELEANYNALGAITNTVASTTIVAPFAGIIARKNVVIGQNIESTTPVFDIAGLNSQTSSFVRFEVPVLEYNKLKIGQGLEVSLAGSDSTNDAVIKRIAQSVNKDTQTITVEGKLGDDDIGAYPLGTNIRVSSQGLSGAKALEIPTSAIGQDEDGKSRVYKVMPNKVIKKWYIEIAFTDSEKTFLNSGLKTTDSIVTQIAGGNWSDGQDISTLVGNTK